MKSIGDLMLAKQMLLKRPGLDNKATKHHLSNKSLKEIQGL
jgi:hypothetical protein